MSAKHEDWLAHLEALSRGDQVAFVKISGVITGFLKRYGAYDLEQEWDDLIQDVMLGLVRAAQRGSIRAPAAFVNYAGSITRNKLADWLERAKRPGRPGFSGEAQDLEDCVNQVDRGEREDTDLLLDLQRAVSDLPEKPRRVLEAVYINGHSYAEASKQLGLPLGTLKRHQTEGLRLLRSHMGIQPRRARSDSNESLTFELEKRDKGDV